MGAADVDTGKADDGSANLPGRQRAPERLKNPGEDDRNVV